MGCSWLVKTFGLLLFLEDRSLSRSAESSDFSLLDFVLLLLLFPQEVQDHGLVLLAVGLGFESGILLLEKVNVSGDLLDFFGLIENCLVGVDFALALPVKHNLLLSLLDLVDLGDASTLVVISLQILVHLLVQFALLQQLG